MASINVLDLSSVAAATESDVLLLIRKNSDGTQTAYQIAAGNFFNPLSSVIVQSAGNSASSVMSQNAVTQLVKGSMAGMTAYEYPSVVVEDFANGYDASSGMTRDEWEKEKLNAWLDGVTFSLSTENIQYIGRCRIGINGINAEVYNIVESFADDWGYQYSIGFLRVKEDGKVYTGDGMSIISRRKANGAWGEWSEFRLGEEYYTKSEVDALLSGLVSSASAEASVEALSSEESEESDKSAAEESDLSEDLDKSE